MSTSAVITTDTHLQLVNKAFVSADELFRQHGWKLVINKFEHILYTKPGFETEFFEIKVNQNSIQVSVPIKNSVFQYKTTFNNYFLASEYVEDKFKDLFDLV
jgi:hypothetical protein